MAETTLWGSGAWGTAPTPGSRSEDGNLQAEARPRAFPKAGTAQGRVALVCRDMCAG